MTWNEFIGEAFKWFRRIFIITKGLVILYLSLNFIYRYYRSEKKILQLEIIMLAGLILLDLLIIVFELWHSVNIIYSVFVFNAIMKAVSAFYF
jgi:hypothetical protein